MFANEESLMTRPGLVEMAAKNVYSTWNRLETCEADKALQDTKGRAVLPLHRGAPANLAIQMFHIL